MKAKSIRAPGKCQLRPFLWSVHFTGPVHYRGKTRLFKQ